MLNLEIKQTAYNTVNIVHKPVTAFTGHMAI
jgi:hypothetical protein